MDKRWICCLTPPCLPPLNSAGPTPRPLLKGDGKGIRRKRTGKTVSGNVGSCEKLIKEEAKDACARPHSGIRLSVTNKVNKDSTKEEDSNKRNQTNNEIANKIKEASIGGGGISVPFPNDFKGYIVSGTRGGLLIDSLLSSDTVN
jgi:hypothetical protein